MTEKRFTNHITKTDADGTIHTDGIFDANENNKILITNYFYIAQVMNELNNENKHLKQVNKRYALMVNCNSDLYDEIYEQLKKTEKNYKSLLNENEQLKRKMNYTRIVIRNNLPKEMVYRVEKGLQKMENELKGDVND